MDEEGYLYFLGRKDDIIKTRGEKVSPREVEDVLYTLPGVAQAAVIGVPDKILGSAVKAVIVREAGAQLTEKDVLRHCASRLDDYMVPKFVEFREEMPTTASGLGVSDASVGAGPDDLLSPPQPAATTIAAAFDLFVCPSLWEGGPLTVVEASHLVGREMAPYVGIVAGHLQLQHRFLADDGLVQQHVVEHRAQRVLGVVVGGGDLDRFADGDAQ